MHETCSLCGYPDVPEEETLKSWAPVITPFATVYVPVTLCSFCQQDARDPLRIRAVSLSSGTYLKDNRDD